MLLAIPRSFTMPNAAWPPRPDTIAPVAAFFSAVAFGTPRILKMRDDGIFIRLDRFLMKVPGTPARSISTICIGVAVATCFTHASRLCFQGPYAIIRPLPTLAVRLYVRVLKCECPICVLRVLDLGRFLGTVLMGSLPL